MAKPKTPKPGKSLSVARSLYLHQLYALGVTVASACDRIFATCVVPEKGYVLKVSPGMQADAEMAILGAANMRKLVFASDPRRSGESAGAYAVRQERSKTLQQALCDLDLSEIKRTAVRNNFEHFDQELDDLVAKLERTGEYPGGAKLAAFNISVSHADSIRAPVYPIRYYVAETRQYHCMGDAIDLGKLREQAATLAERCRALLGPEVGEPGGMIFTAGFSAE